MAQVQAEVTGLNALMQAFERVIARIPPELSQALDDSARDTQRTMQANAPHATGEFASTIKITRGIGRASIGPDNSRYGGRPVAEAIEFGRGAGRPAPPAAALRNRYGLGAAQAKKAALTIEARGIPATRFVEKTYHAVRTRYEDRGIRAVSNIVRDF